MHDQQRRVCEGSSPYLTSMYMEVGNLFNPFLSLRPSITTRISSAAGTHAKNTPHYPLLAHSILHQPQPPKKRRKFFLFFVRKKPKKPPRNMHRTNPTLWFLHRIGSEEIYILHLFIHPRTTHFMHYHCCLSCAPQMLTVAGSSDIITAGTSILHTPFHQGK
jgi:hypothetical protein